MLELSKLFLKWFSMSYHNFIDYFLIKKINLSYINMSSINNNIIRISLRIYFGAFNIALKENFGF